ncbi:envelope biogenesis factor ElyC, partial [Vibrio sp. Vb2880]|nr:envelope biogenesis factor ElyC [Vibrio sp. Vb2880]
VVSAMLMPLPALLLIGLLGLALISFTTKRKTGCFVVLFSFVGIFLVAFQPVSTKLLMPLEREHKAFLPVSGTIVFRLVLA